MRRAEIAEARRDANTLLAFVLNKNQTFLVAHSEYELSDEEEKAFQATVARRAKREPVQYITGRQEFYGLDFAVAPGVLIPRPETEIIVENALEILRLADENAKICEVGTGSGCIAISILHNLKTATATALDVSENALEIARQNAARHRVADRIEFKISDVFAGLNDEKFDLIASNPPYISPDKIETLQPEVKNFEPLNALTDGRDGFSIIEKIVSDAPRFLKPGGVLLMEIGYDQSAETRRMFAPDVWQSIEILPDLQGIDRTVKSRTAER